MKVTYRNSTQLFLSPCHCMSCGKVFIVPRLRFSKRESGHVKTMFCFNCKCDQDFIETKNGTQFEFEYWKQYIEHQKQKKAVAS